MRLCNPIKLGLMLLSFSAMQMAWADEATEQSYLAQIHQALQAIQPLVKAAKAAQPPHQRIRFHYTRWQDREGVWHAGLEEDLKTLTQGVAAGVETLPEEARALAPIRGDYVEQAHAR